MRDAVERIVHPPQRADVDSAAQRAEMHDRLTKQAFAANAAGDTAEAASLFAQASGFDPRRTTIISHVNMRLKLGECELAAACYERLLAGETLSETAWYMAAVAIAEQRSRNLAAAALGRAGRRAAAGEHALPLTARQPPLLPPPPQPASPSLVPLGRSDPLEQIGKLKGLLDAGAVTEDEFESGRRRSSWSG